jgi:hypothetical protein
MCALGFTLAFCRAEAAEAFQHQSIRMRKERDDALEMMEAAMDRIHELGSMGEISDSNRRETQKAYSDLHGECDELRYEVPSRVWKGFCGAHDWTQKSACCLCSHKFYTPMIICMTVTAAGTAMERKIRVSRKCAESSGGRPRFNTQGLQHKANTPQLSIFFDSFCLCCASKRTKWPCQLYRCALRGCSPLVSVETHPGA